MATAVPAEASQIIIITLRANRLLYSMQEIFLKPDGVLQGGTHCQVAEPLMLQVRLFDGYFQCNLYAIWTATVTFDGQGAPNPTMLNVTAPATTVGTLPIAPSKTGYTFSGWFTGTNGTGTQFLATTTVTASITVYARWTATVTFDGQGAPNPTSIGVIPPANNGGDFTYYSLKNRLYF